MDNTNVSRSVSEDTLRAYDRKVGRAISIKPGLKVYNDNDELQGEIFNDLDNNVANSPYSHAEGSSTIASGAMSHAEGYRTKATNGCSHAEGLNTTASGEGAHSGGRFGTEAAGEASFAHGTTVKAIANYSVAFGYQTQALSDTQFVIGKFNIPDDEAKYAFIVGNGTDVDNQSNLFAIGTDGKLYLNGSETGLDLTPVPQSLVDEIFEDAS